MSCIHSVSILCSECVIVASACGIHKRLDREIRERVVCDGRNRNSTAGGDDPSRRRRCLRSASRRCRCDGGVFNALTSKIPVMSEQAMIQFVIAAPQTLSTTGDMPADHGLTQLVGRGTRTRLKASLSCIFLGEKSQIAAGVKQNASHLYSTNRV